MAACFQNLLQACSRRAQSPIRQGPRRAPLAAGLRRLCAECALGMPRMRPASRAHHSFFESKFKAPKTPLSHGFAGLVAIKARAKKACFWAYPALERQTKRGLKRPLPCGLAGWAAIAAVAHEKKRLANARRWRLACASCALNVLCACSEHIPKPECALGMHRMCLASRAFHSFFGSKSKAPKTPLSHGFRGLVAIKARAKKG